MLTVPPDIPSMVICLVGKGGVAFGEPLCFAPGMAKVLASVFVVGGSWIQGERC